MQTRKLSAFFLVFLLFFSMFSIGVRRGHAIAPALILPTIPKLNGIILGLISSGLTFSSIPLMDSAAYWIINRASPSLLNALNNFTDTGSLIPSAVSEISTIARGWSADFTAGNVVETPLSLVVPATSTIIHNSNTFNSPTFTSGQRAVLRVWNFGGDFVALGLSAGLVAGGTRSLPLPVVPAWETHWMRDHWRQPARIPAGAIAEIVVDILNHGGNILYRVYDSSRLLNPPAYVVSSSGVANRLILTIVLKHMNNDGTGGTWAAGRPQAVAFSAIGSAVVSPSILTPKVNDTVWHDELVNRRLVGWPVGWPSRDTAQGTETLVGQTAGSLTGQGAITSTEAMPAIELSLLQQIAFSLTRFFDMTIPINFAPLNTIATTLHTRFPFSIPWDIGYIFSFFEVPGKPLEIDFPILLPGQSVSQASKIQFDLSQFDSILALFRGFIGLGFIYGVLSKTKSWLAGE